MGSKGREAWRGEATVLMKLIGAFLAGTLRTGLLNIKLRIAIITNPLEIVKNTNQHQLSVIPNQHYDLSIFGIVKVSLLNIEIIAAIDSVITSIGAFFRPFIFLSDLGFLFRCKIINDTELLANLFGGFA
jgi:hypothetical protein